MKRIFNILLVIFFITLIVGIYNIKKYEDLYIKNVTDSALYFQNPSRKLLKVNCLFDEAMYEIHKYHYHKYNNLLKPKLLLISAKNLLKDKKKYKHLIEIIDKVLDSENIKNEEMLINEFHKELNKVSFLEYKTAVRFFEKYKNDIKKFQTILYTIIIVILLLSISLLVILYQTTLLRRITLLSETDQLTKAYNRRKFFEEVRKHNDDYSIVMFDIDHFKKINDTYGHDKGDYVLKTLVELVRKNIRKDDMIFRWGGEEFFILFKKMNLKEAHRTAEKLREIVADYNFDGISVTISLSVVNSKDGQVIEKIIKILDEGLYEAKNSGRNKVVVKGVV